MTGYCNRTREDFKKSRRYSDPVFETKRSLNVSEETKNNTNGQRGKSMSVLNGWLNGESMEMYDEEGRRVGVDIKKT